MSIAHDLALSNPGIERWFNTAAGFNRIAAQQPMTYDPRTFPQRVTALRRDPINNVDLSVIKNTPITNGKVLQLRLEGAEELQPFVLWSPRPESGGLGLRPGLRTGHLRTACAGDGKVHLLVRGVGDAR